MTVRIFEWPCVLLICIVHTGDWIGAASFIWCLISALSLKVSLYGRHLLCVREQCRVVVVGMVGLEGLHFKCVPGREDARYAFSCAWP